MEYPWISDILSKFSPPSRSIWPSSTTQKKRVAGNLGIPGGEWSEWTTKSMCFAVHIALKQWFLGDIWWLIMRGPSHVGYLIWLGHRSNLGIGQIWELQYFHQNFHQIYRCFPSQIQLFLMIYGCFPAGLLANHFELFIELDDGKIYRKALYLKVKTMVSCRFSLKPIHWTFGCLASLFSRRRGLAVFCPTFALASQATF